MTTADELQAVLNEHFETHRYAGTIPDWRTMPETGDDPDDDPVDKLAKQRKLTAPAFDTPANSNAEHKYRRVLSDAFTKLGASVARQVRTKLAARLHKADLPDEHELSQEDILGLAQKLVDDLDLSELEMIIDGTLDLGKLVVGTNARIAVAQIGLADEQDIIDDIDLFAAEWAQQRAAELVGMRYDDLGHLVESNNAEMRIDEPTRTMVRNVISEGLATGMREDEIAAKLQVAYPFSDERAALIANTEIRRAVSHGALVGYKKGAEYGVDMKKSWLVDGAPCPICIENGDAGAIDLDDEFPSGDEAPPAHPNAVFAGHVFASYGALHQMLRARYNGPAVALELVYCNERSQHAFCNSSASSDLTDADVRREELMDDSLLALRERGRVLIGIEPSYVTLTIGPNHPVLTRRGFVRANFLHEGDELLYDCTAIQTPIGSDKSNFEEVPAIEDCFETLRSAFGASLSSGPRTYFHGDEVAIYGEVEVVKPTRDLLAVLDATFIKGLSQCPLTGANTTAKHLASCRACQLLFDRLFLAASGSMSSASQCLALGGCALCPPQFKTMRVVSCHETTFVGWAFDASTQYTMYVSGGVIVKNCMCAITPIVVDETGDYAEE